MIQNRAQQYVRTTGSSYAPMMLRIVWLCIDHVPVAHGGETEVSREPPGQLRKGLDALVPAGRPAIAKDHHAARRPRLEIAQELGAKRADRRRAGVVEEVEVVDEARGLFDVQTQQCVDTAALLRL